MENQQTNAMAEMAATFSKIGEQLMQDYMKSVAAGVKNDGLKDVFETYSEFTNQLIENPASNAKVQDLFKTFISNQHELWKRILERQLGITKTYEPVIKPADNDKRFKSAEWDQAPYYFDFIKQNYLLVSKLMTEVVTVVDMPTSSKKKLAFYTQQYLDALAPSNFAMTNPEVLKLAQETNGASLIEGFKNFLTDFEKGGITQTDMNAFTPGKNIAITPGEVVFENELMQLIQYKATTSQVYEKPLLILPPWINKYYILDLRPENSLAKFLVDQGMTTFMISWKNPTTEGGAADITFDDYVQKAAFKAIEVVQSITGAPKINTMGYCLGGTLLGSSLAILAKNKSKAESPINTATFLATMIDFSDIGPMGDIIDEKLVKTLEEGDIIKGGIMSGHDMEYAFNFIRANDLVWSFVVNSYLKGKTPAPFDVMYWTNDNTNLPAKMYLFYLRQMVFENKLSRKNALRICDTPIDIGKIDVPTYVIGMQEDHIAPAVTAFTTTELVSGPVEFILGESGHVMGVVNPTSKKKYGYYADGELERGFQHWKDTAKYTKESWWSAWIDRLSKKSGKLVPAPKKIGNAEYKAIEPAPGRYVLEKNHGHHAKKGEKAVAQHSDKKKIEKVN